ncbi:Uncharacterised protein [Klebsiella variicola]|nr:Uncharacterised protein [Klebsiella variicola]VDZ86544.1 Uncharacterised protein [Kluyvera intermedia]
MENFLSYVQNVVRPRTFIIMELHIERLMRKETKVNVRFVEVIIKKLNVARWFL